MTFTTLSPRWARNSPAAALWPLSGAGQRAAPCVPKRSHRSAAAEKQPRPVSSPQSPPDPAPASAFAPVPSSATPHQPQPRLQLHRLHRHWPPEGSSVSLGRGPHPWRQDAATLRTASFAQTHKRSHSDTRSSDARAPPQYYWPAPWGLAVVSVANSSVRPLLSRVLSAVLRPVSHALFLSRPTFSLVPTWRCGTCSLTSANYLASLGLSGHTWCQVTA